MLLGLVLVGGIYIIVKAVLSCKTKIAIIEQQSEIQKNRDRLTIEARQGARLLETQFSQAMEQTQKDIAGLESDR